MNVVGRTIWVIIAGALITVIYFISTFSIFDEPASTIIDNSCDYEGIRRATVYSLSGNAVTNESIHVAIDHCDQNFDWQSSQDIFTGEPIGSGQVKAVWNGFDSLVVEYSSIRRISTKGFHDFGDSSLKINIVYKELESPQTEN
ncbi:hypothetical protein [Lewinella sp. IMCC34183]|uniref:hypothetical protein n=1 Tax=Lewinella sp. IMCC34183 TaxID=2248762 RepID=UPI00130061C2|nr:hypothetical protein [Lewinella sp. IMCC34183]